MAKGLRSSIKKSNRAKLRSKVFAPVEDARTKRLHAKLLEAVQQVKPEPAKETNMDVDSVNGKLSHHTPFSASGPHANASPEPEQQDSSEGSSYISVATIPHTFSEPSEADGEEVDCETAVEAQADTDMFYLGLGLCSDIVGFAPDGRLLLQFHY
jgi:hypothetical protein